MSGSAFLMLQLASLLTHLVTVLPSTASCPPAFAAAQVAGRQGEMHRGEMEKHSPAWWACIPVVPECQQRFGHMNHLFVC